MAPLPDREWNDMPNLPFCLECGASVTEQERSVPRNLRDPNEGLDHLCCYAARRAAPAVAA